MRVVLTLLLIGAAVWMDLQTCRISNRLIVSGLLLGVFIQIGEYGTKGVGIFILKVSIPVVLLYLLFLMRALGAGDIKLFSVISSVWNLKITGVTVVAAFLAAAIMSLCKLIYNRNLLTRLNIFWEYLYQTITLRKIEQYPGESDGKQNFIHFSVAILIGFITALGVVN